MNESVVVKHESSQKMCTTLIHFFFIVIHQWQILLLQHVWNFETTFSIKYTHHFIGLVVFNSEKHAKREKGWAYVVLTFMNISPTFRLARCLFPVCENCMIKVQL